MATLGIVTGIAVANSGVTLLARIVGNLGTPITVATMTNPVYVTVTDLTLQAQGLWTPQSALLPAPSACIFNALVTNDPRWTRDSQLNPGPDNLWGYNFSYTIPATYVTNGGDRYQADVAFIPVSGQPFRVVYQFTPVKVYG